MTIQRFSSLFYPIFIGLLAMFSQASLAKELLISASSSLTEPLTEISQHYERENPGWQLRLNFAATPVLVRQIKAQSSVDVFLSAALAPVSTLVGEGMIEHQVNFASTELVLILSPKWAQAKDSIPELIKQSSSIALCDPSVPIGDYAKQYLQKEGLWDLAVSKKVQADNVKGVVGFVERGLVDVGFVYASDLAKKNIAMRPLPRDKAPQVQFAGGVLSKSSQKKEAIKFVQYLQTPKGRKILEKYKL